MKISMLSEKTSYEHTGSVVKCDTADKSFYLQRCTLPDKRCLSHGMCLYQIMTTLHFLNDVANDAESTQKLKITP